ncbi:hypothetical protein PGB90_003169 [Kerria lacca]
MALARKVGLRIDGDGLGSRFEPFLFGTVCGEESKSIGCRLNGQTFSLNKNITLQEDPCLKCSCNGGSMMCSKNACPVLQCPNSSILHFPGDCCPKCKGSRQLISPPKGSCLLGSVRKAGETVRFDRCTFCSCMNSTSVCRRETCPPLNCPLERQFYPKHESCCPQCPSHYENRTVCQVGDRIFRDEEMWQVNECKS